MIKNIIFDLKKNKNKIKKYIKKYFATGIFLLLAFTAFSYFISKSDFNINTNLEKRFEEVYIDRDLEMEIYFNTDEDSLIFRETIVDAIENAEETIEVAVYSMNIKEIFEALKRKSREGVDIKIITPAKKINNYYNLYFVDSNVEYKGIGEVSSDNQNTEDDLNRIDKLNDKPLMHHKFIIIDRDTQNEKIFFGTTNLTDIQERFDAGYIMETKDPEIIKYFKNEFDIIWNGSSGLEKLKNIDYKIVSNRLHYNNGYIELWFGPGFKEQSLKHRIQDLIRSSEKSIVGINWFFTDFEIFSSLKKASLNNIETKLIIDDVNLWTKESVFNRSNWGNIEIISDAYNNLNSRKREEKFPNLKDDFNPFLHHHFVIVDEKVLVTGTSNWTLRGFYINDENSLVTNIDYIVDQFDSIYNRYYKKNRSSRLEFSYISDSQIILKNDFPKDSKVILYDDIGKSDLNNSGICNEFELSSDNIINIDDNCKDKNILIFVVDDNDNLIASDYLHSRDN